LSWANGRVPTPYGPIEVKWEKQDESFVLEFSVPDGTRGSTGVPFAGSAGSLMLNGHSVKTAARLSRPKATQVEPATRTCGI